MHLSGTDKMSKDSSFLYTGQTSASRRAEKELQKAVEKEEKRRKLAPSADVVLELIEKEQTKISKRLLDYITTDKTEEDYKSILESLKLYYEYLASLKVQLSVILKRGKHE